MNADLRTRVSSTDTTNITGQQKSQNNKTNNKSGKIFFKRVWCGILGDRIIGPHIYEDTLNGIRYLQFLKQEFIHYLEDIPLLQRQNLWF
jgi:hypothetical protein